MGKISGRKNLLEHCFRVAPPPPPSFPTLGKPVPHYLQGDGCQVTVRPGEGWWGTMNILQPSALAAAELANRPQRHIKMGEMERWWQNGGKWGDWGEMGKNGTTGCS